LFAGPDFGVEDRRPPRVRPFGCYARSTGLSVQCRSGMASVRPASI